MLGEKVGCIHLVFYRAKEISGGFSFGAKFSDQDLAIPLFITAFCNPVMGQVGSTVSSKISNVWRVSTRIDYNIYSCDAVGSIGISRSNFDNFEFFNTKFTDLKLKLSTSCLPVF